MSVAMTEQQAITYLGQWFGELFRMAGRATDGGDDGFGPVIDEAWSFMGLTRGTDIAPDRTKTVTIISAFAYRMALNWLVVLFNSQTDAPTTRLETFQVYQGTLPLAQQAFREAKRYGFGGAAAVVSDLRVDDIRGQRESAARVAGTGRRYGRSWTEFG